MSDHEARSVRPPRARHAVASVVLVLVTTALTSTTSRPAVAVPTRPNLVLIVTDDQRWDSMGQLPRTNAMVSWLRFSKAYVNEPQCCPSRATIFTGRYSHHTGVETLADGPRLDESRTIATMLRGAGYRTGLFGKYLNGYPFRRGLYVPPGWDRFSAFVTGYSYYNYSLNQNGILASYGSDPADYSTDVLTAQAANFISSTAPTAPLFLEVAYNAPHHTATGPPVPAPRHVGSCANTTMALPANFNRFDTISEPSWMAGETAVSSSSMIRQRRATCETLRGVDDGIQAIVRELARTGRLSNTYIVLISDNGYAFGEHRLTGKGDLYESSVRVPLLASGPGVVPGSSIRLTSNVDLVPTLLEWASVAAPLNFLDGASFAASARGDTTAPVPGEVLLRGCRTGRTTNLECGGYRTDMGRNWGLRTSVFKYVEYPDGYRQLFYLARDPFELTNLAAVPSMAPTVANLHARLVARRGF
jgi:arylsulfatase A-like enzyme